MLVVQAWQAYAEGPKTLVFCPTVAEGKTMMPWCRGEVDGCTAGEVRCDCGVMSCVEHGHVDAGDDPYL